MKDQIDIIEIIYQLFNELKNSNFKTKFIEHEMAKLADEFVTSLNEKQRTKFNKIENFVFDLISHHEKLLIEYVLEFIRATQK